MNARRTFWLGLLTAAVSACALGPSPSVGPVESRTGGSIQPAPPTELTIYAAASLKAALLKVQAVFEPDWNVRLTISTDSSTALETKIEQAAPADVFLSADTANPQKLVDKGLASGSVVTFAGNLLTVIVPAANPASIVTPADLAKPGVKIVAAADGVPIQKYAAKLVTNLAKEAGYPAGFAVAYAANVISKEDNVGAVASKIGLGEGDAAIVYVTDAKAWDNIRTIDVPADANVPATYGGVVVKASTNQAAAASFLAWLAGPDGQAILATFGFLPPS